MSGFTREFLMGLADSLAKTVTDPKYLARVQEIQNADPDARYALAQQVNPASMREEGVEIPDGFRCVPRTFENPEYALENGVQPAGCEPGSDRREVILKKK